MLNHVSFNITNNYCFKKYIRNKSSLNKNDLVSICFQIPNFAGPNEIILLYSFQSLNFGDPNEIFLLLFLNYKFC